MHPFGKIVRKNPIWFKVGISGLEPAIMAALLDYERKPQATLAAFRNVELEVTPKASHASVRTNAGTACAIGLS